MPKTELPLGEGLYPVPVALVSCIDQTTQRPNIITIAWCGIICSTPPQVSVSIRPSRFSFNLIKEAKNFVINIPSTDMVKAVDICGMKSGRDTDKFKLCKFNKQDSREISSPAIEECPVNIECILKDIRGLGSHHMFMAEVANIRANSNVVDSQNRIDFAKAKPIVFNRGEYWSLGKKIGHYGFSE